MKNVLSFLMKVQDRDVTCGFQIRNFKSDF